MGSEFKKLIICVFGKKEYTKFAIAIKKCFQSKSDDDKAIFNEMYHLLRGIEQEALEDKLELLEDTMMTVLRICRYYLAAVIVYAIAVTALWLKVSNPVFLYPGIGLLTVGIVYKTYEFVVNKFGYVDVRLVLTYKEALEAVLQETKDPEDEDAD